MFIRRSLAAIAALLLCGCPDTDAAVFVEPSIEGPAATLQMSALVAALDGSFTLNLHLGPRASGQSLAQLKQLSLTSQDRSATLISPLEVTTDPSFPVTVEVDSDVTVAISFAAENNQAELSLVPALCDPNGIVIVGALDDSLRGATVPVASAPFQVQSCP